MNPQPAPPLPIESRIARKRERIARWGKEAEGAGPFWSGGDDYRKFCEGMAAAARKQIAELEAELTRARGQ